MHMIKRTFQTLVIAVFAIPVSAYAESWSCSHDNNVREVHIERTTSAPVPCNVVYKKQTEGVEDQILWNAENDESYCEEKAKDFVAKLESWGWVCAETISDDASTGDDAGMSGSDEDATMGDTGGMTDAVEDAATDTDAEMTEAVEDTATDTDAEMTEAVEDTATGAER